MGFSEDKKDTSKKPSGSRKKNGYCLIRCVEGDKLLIGDDIEIEILISQIGDHDITFAVKADQSIKFKKIPSIDAYRRRREKKD